MNNDLLISLNQGKQFKTYQNKIKKSVLKTKIQSNKRTSVKEGFVTAEQEMLIRPSDEGYNQVLANSAASTNAINSINQSELDELNNLKTKYNNLIQQYNNIQQTIGNSSLATINRTNPSNPYLNKNIRFNNGTICYVTNQGTVKPYTTPEVYMNTAGKNGCPAANEIVNIDLPFLSSYGPGSEIPTTPSLIVGTNMVDGQSCGSEGKNVYVSNLVNSPSSTYVGCYNDKPIDVNSIDDSQRAMIWNPSAISYTTYDKCQQYALDNGYQYFGLQNYQADGTSGCLVSNDITRTQMYGDGSIKINSTTPLWSTNTSQAGNRMVLAADTGINVINGNTPLYYSNFNGIKFFSDCGFSGQQTNALLGQHDIAQIGFPNDSLSSVIVPNNFGVVIFRDGLGTEPSITLGAGQYPCLVDNGWNDLASSYTGYYNGNCYLLLQDDGNLCISTGTPGLEYNLIWAAGTAGKTAGPNPLWEASKGKYGRNYIQLGEGLNPGEWVGSNDGSLKLIMQTDGNLVLYTSTVGPGCVNISNDKTAGGAWVNAVYKIDNNGNKASLEKAGYINNDAVLQEYPSSMLSLSNTYKIINGADSWGNDLGSWSGGTEQDCQNKCNANTDCYGYSYNNSNQSCWIKDKNMYPTGQIQDSQSFNLGIRRQNILNPPGCSNQINDVDTIQFDNYIKGNTMTPSSQCNVPMVSQQDQMNYDNIKSQLSILGQDIASKMENLYSQDKNIYKKFNMNESQFKKDIEEYKNVNLKIRKELEIESNNKNSNNNNMEGMMNMNDVNGMVSNSDLIVLQENYSYIFWSVLAIGIVTVTINIMKK